jgi:hypothetical protein
MGRDPLLTLFGALVLAVAACGSDAVRRADGDPHGGLACAECHRGGLADRQLAAVPPETCTGSGCHENDVPGEVTLATVRFTHRDHGSSESLVLGCAGCHTHASGSEPLHAGPETCGLCHVEELSGTRGEDCHVCHTAPTHAGVTTQGLAIPHQGLPWIQGGCLRCHYAVARPVHEVSLGRCVRCHDDTAAMTRIGIGEDLHPTHVGTHCSACHEADNHRIEAMSSAVRLECEACHSVEHDVEVDEGLLASRTCVECHREEHQDQQRLLLGILPEASAAAPDDHFMDGLTCRSCHIPVGESTEAPRPGTAEACVSCHRPEYAVVLRWWNQGVDERLRLVDSYLSGAERAVAGEEEVGAGRQATARARRLLDLVRRAGGQHNLPLAHRVFEQATAAATEAYRSAGRVAPPRPDLGRPPRQGICTYCHYRLAEPGLTERMDDAFHREVVGRR